MAIPIRNRIGEVLNFVSRNLPIRPNITSGIAVAKPIWPINAKEKIKLFFKELFLYYANVDTV